MDSPFGKWAVLRQEPGGAGRGCRREPGGRGICGEDQDTDPRAGSLDLACGFDAVGAGQPDVHQHGVGMAGDRQRDGFLGRSHCTHAVHIGLSVYRDLQGAGERLLVLYHQYPCHEAARLSPGPVTGRLYPLVGADGPPASGERGGGDRDLRPCLQASRRGVMEKNPRGLTGQ